MKEKRQRNMKNNTLIIIAVILAIISFILVYIGSNYENIKDIFVKTEKVDTVFKTDTVYKDTVITFFKEKLVPKEVFITKIDTLYTNEGKDTILKTETKLYQDTLCENKDSIILKNYISGINPTLDSISVVWKKQETLVTNTETITKYISNKRKIHVGLQTGYGIGIISKKAEPYIGIGITLDLF